MLFRSCRSALLLSNARCNRIRNQSGQFLEKLSALQTASVPTLQQEYAALATAIGAINARQDVSTFVTNMCVLRACVDCADAWRAIAHSLKLHGQGSSPREFSYDLPCSFEVRASLFGCDCSRSESIVTLQDIQANRLEGQNPNSLFRATLPHIMSLQIVKHRLLLL
mgnify:CR=1 FL=1